MKIIKIVMAMGILSCLFFPLSQCTGVPGGHPEPSEFDQKIQYDEADNIQESSSNVHQVISGIDDIKDVGNFPIVLAFILPLLFCISAITRKWKLLILILQTVNQAWLIYLTFMLVWIFSEPLWGGWLLTVCALIYFLITIIEWIDLFRKKQLA